MLARYFWIFDYQVSSVGRVRNAISGKILKPSIESNGYHRIVLYKNNSQTPYLIHRLVAQEFIENPDNKNCVDHINHTRAENTIQNLRGGSKSQSAMYKTKIQNASSKYKSVNFNKNAKKWCARIKVDGKQKHRGLFYNETETAAKHNEAALEHVGEHGLLDKISSDEEDEDEDEEDEQTDDT